MAISQATKVLRKSGIMPKTVPDEGIDIKRADYYRSLAIGSTGKI